MGLPNKYNGVSNKLHSHHKNIWIIAKENNQVSFFFSFLLFFWLLGSKFSLQVGDQSFDISPPNLKINLHKQENNLVKWEWSIQSKHYRKTLFWSVKFNTKENGSEYINLIQNLSYFHFGWRYYNTNFDKLKFYHSVFHMDSFSRWRPQTKPTKQIKIEQQNQRTKIVISYQLD